MAVLVIFNELEWTYKSDLFIVLVLNKTFWFTGVLNLTIGQGWLYLGRTAKFDRFMRCVNTNNNYIRLGQTKLEKFWSTLLLGLNLLVAFIWVFVFRLVGILGVGLYTWKLILILLF